MAKGRRRNVATIEAPEQGAVVGRTLRELAWMRIKRDWVARICMSILLFIVIVALLAGPICAFFGVDAVTGHPELIEANGSSLPLGRFGGASWDHPLGIEPGFGRDVMARLLAGARTSLLIATVATTISISMGVVIGVFAGNLRGRADALMSRFIDLMLAFPVLLLILSTSPILNREMRTFFGQFNWDNDTTNHWANVTMLILMLSVFSWPYLARIIRGQVLSLREREFVEAAISLGASNRTILFRELLPNLLGPIIVFTTLSFPGVIAAEAGLAYLGISVQEPDASWGKILTYSLTYFIQDPTYFVIPLTLLIAVVLSFNLLGDALRDALDPRAARN
ncbi:MAG: ABC transporter permease [Actinobacteria bacterium]|nr:ABC transporter permease [Actinomycetota bacterium]NBY15316.1 ABC transporter permease [Actinomycetota bacterium]